MRTAVLVALATLASCAKDKASPRPDPAAEPCKDPFVDTDDDESSGPEPEVQRPTVSLDLPPVPTFTLPSPNPDGSRTVKELRVAGRRLDEQQVSIRGVVAFIDDLGFWLADTATDRHGRWIAVRDVTGAPKVALGDAVVVTATVHGHRPLTSVSVAPAP